MVVSDWRISILAIQAGCNLLLCGLDRNLNRKLLGPYEDINVGRGKKKNAFVPMRLLPGEQISGSCQLGLKSLSF